MSLTELLYQAKSQRSPEFLFIVGGEPRVRTNTGWKSLRSSPGLITEWRLLQQNFLDDNQRFNLEEKGVVQGETEFAEHRVGFSFFQQNETMKMVLDFDLDTAREEIQIPHSVLESCNRMKGLVLLSGTGDSGQTTILHSILSHMGEGKSFLAAVLSPKAFPQLKEDKASFVYHSGQFNNLQERESLLSGVDVVVFHNSLDEEKTILEALSLAEQGVFVIYAMRSPSISNSIRRWLSVLSDKLGQHGSARFAEIINLGFGQHSMVGINGERAYAHEVLLMKPNIREFIETQNVKGIDSAMINSPDNTGVLTLNQSLLQLLIRRRVSLKSAFETSRDPQGLDQLLKKVGI